MTINLYVSGSRLYLKEFVTISQGNVNSIKIQFNFDEEDTDWQESGIQKIALFQYQQSAIFFSNIESDGSIFIPTFVVAKPGFKVALQGQLNGQIIQTEVVEIPVEYSPQVLDLKQLAISSFTNTDNTMSLTQSGATLIINFDPIYKNAVDSVINDSYLKNDGDTAGGIYQFTNNGKNVIINSNGLVVSQNESEKTITIGNEEINIDGFKIGGGYFKIGNATLNLPQISGTIARLEDVNAVDSSAKAYTDAEVAKIVSGVTLAGRAYKDSNSNLINVNNYYAYFDFELNSSTGIITLKFYNQANELLATKTIDTALEQIASVFRYEDGKLYVTTIGGTVEEVDLRDLIDTYTFNNTATISFTTDSSGKIVQASVNNHSIGLDQLSTTFVDTWNSWTQQIANIALAESERVTAENQRIANENARIRDEENRESEFENMVNTTLTAHAIPISATPTITKTGGSGMPYNLDFGLPTGNIYLPYLYIDLATGQLMIEYDENYEGVLFRINQSGQLEVYRNV